MNELLKILKAISNESRLRILKLLLEKPMCVCEIREVLGLSQPAVSRHLSQLKNVGLIIDKKDGIWVNYLIRTASNNTYISELLKKIDGWLNRDNIILSDKKRAGEVNRKEICKINDGK